jgi:hypothetical protein
MYTNTNVHMYTNTNVHMNTNTNVHIYPNTNVHMYTNTNVHMYTNTQQDATIVPWFHCQITLHVVTETRWCDQPPDFGQLLKWTSPQNSRSSITYDIPATVTAVIVLLMMGAESARNMWSDIAIKPRYYIHSPMKMEQTRCSETSAIKHHTPGNNPKDYTQHLERDESLKSRTIYYCCILLDICVHWRVILKWILKK